MSWLEVELALIPVFLAAIGGLVWLVRLEGRNKRTYDRLMDMKEDIQRLEREVKEHEKESIPVRDGFHRIETDIKHILRKLDMNGRHQ